MLNVVMLGVAFSYGSVAFFIVMLSVVMMNVAVFIVMLSVSFCFVMLRFFMLNVMFCIVILSVIMLNITFLFLCWVSLCWISRFCFMLSFVVLSAIMLSANMLNVVMLSVLTPSHFWAQTVVNLSIAFLYSNVYCNCCIFYNLLVWRIWAHMYLNPLNLPMKHHTLKNVRNCGNAKITFNLETSGGQSSNPHLKVVEFFNTSFN